MLGDKRLKVYKTEVVKANGEPSCVIKSDGELIIACGANTAIKLIEIQLEGSKRMETKQWLMGNKIEVGTKL